MRVHAAQLDLAWHDGKENCRRLEQLVGDAFAAGDLLVLPEMFASGFTPDVDAAVEASEFAARFCAASARESRCHVLAGLVRSDGQRGRNLAVLFGPEGEVASYQKVHPFCGFEQQRYAAGDVTPVWQIGECSVRPAICYDLRFPELFRTGDAERRPELIVVIASWPAPRIRHWSALLRARAIENQCYVVGVNRTGRDPHAEYVGRSVMVDPMGDTIAEADDRPQILSATLDFEVVRSTRRSFPFQRDQRIGSHPMRRLEAFRDVTVDSHAHAVLARRRARSDTDSPSHASEAGSGTGLSR